jgi:hypothetical protein
MEEMPPLNMAVQRVKVAILPLDLPCPGTVIHLGEILTIGKSHRKKPDNTGIVQKVAQIHDRYNDDELQHYQKPLCCMSSDLLCFVTCLPVSEMSLIMF